MYKISMGIEITQWKGFTYLFSHILTKNTKKSKEKDWQEKEECCIIYERQKARTGLWKLNRKRQFQISKDISENKKRKKRKALELNQMESLILAQDERWRHA